MNFLKPKSMDETVVSNIDTDKARRITNKIVASIMGEGFNTPEITFSPMPGGKHSVTFTMEAVNAQS